MEQVWMTPPAQMELFCDECGTPAPDRLTLPGEIHGCARLGAFRFVMVLKLLPILDAIA